ncbi:MAG: hypothetical protein PF589_09400 [Gammaproteobacteria bacterium]|jgi:hypothetical protein|nr:hypothetical protein [Gammaproteobacteria bacterium]
MATQDNTTDIFPTPKDAAVINKIRRIVEETRFSKEDAQPGATVLPINKYDSTHDDLNMTLAQADAVANLVMHNGGQGNFEMSHETIINSIWCIQGLIKQAMQIVERSEVKAITTHDNALSGDI